MIVQDHPHDNERDISCEYLHQRGILFDLGVCKCWPWLLASKIDKVGECRHERSAEADGAKDCSETELCHFYAVALERE